MFMVVMLQCTQFVHYRPRVIRRILRFGHIIKIDDGYFIRRTK